MPRRQDHLCRLLGGKPIAFRHDNKLLISSPWASEIKRIYHELGGILDDCPTRPGNWDICIDQQIASKNLDIKREIRIELDEELHFNRYRLITLKALFYSRLKAFPLEKYRQYCANYEPEALRAGKYGRKWTTESAEKQFGPAGPYGELDGNGAPRWKQRAFYDMLKDLASLSFNITLARISVWDQLTLENRKTDKVRDFLKPGPEPANRQQLKELKKLMLCRFNISNYGKTKGL